MAEKNNANIGFEEQLWKAACVLWGHIPAAEYRKVIVGLIFLRYISSVFDKRYQELLAEGDGFENDPIAYLAENIFFVPEEARWAKISESAHTPEIGKIIDEAMLAIERENKSLKGVLPKNYGSPDLDKRVLGEVVDLFTNNVKMDDTEESKDLLGRTYEYCIAQFAAYEGTKGGEFYTPSSIVKTLVSDALIIQLMTTITRVGFKGIIDEYNSGGSQNEDFYEKLLELMKLMKEEESRHVKEDLSEEELEIFDLLCKDSLTKEEEKKVKLAAKSLYNTLIENKKELFVVDWQNDPTPREKVRSKIISVLNEYLPDSYDRIIFQTKSDIIFEHIVEQATMGYNWLAA